MRWFYVNDRAFNFNQLCALSLRDPVSRSLLAHFPRSLSPLPPLNIQKFLTAFGGNNMLINPNDIAGTFSDSDKPCTGKKSIPISELVEKFPIVTVNGFQFISNDINDFPVFTFEESDDFFFYVRNLMLQKFLIKLIQACGFLSNIPEKDILAKWDEAMTKCRLDGAEADVNQSLATFPVKLKIQLTRTKDGKKVYSVSVVKKKFSEQKNDAPPLQSSATDRKVADFVDDPELPF